MKVTELADYIVRYYNSVGDIVSNKKLNKVLYYIQGWHMAYFKGSLLFNEVPQAWVHGPVYPAVYAQYRWNNNIRATEDECNPEKLISIINTFKLTSEQKNFLQSSLVHYSKKSGAELELLTHAEKPWLETRGGLPEHVASEREIDLDLMKSYFTARLQKAKS